MNSEPHLDAETLAAWAEDRLPAAERGVLEAHAADCERCQALLAAMVRTETTALSESKWPALSERSESKWPALSERSEPKWPALSERSESKWWRRVSPLGWAVPLAAATAAVIWLVASPVMNREPKLVGETAQVAEESPSPAPSPLPTPEMTIAGGDVTTGSPRALDALKVQPRAKDAHDPRALADKVEVAPPAGALLAAPAPAAPAAAASVPAAGAQAGTVDAERKSAVGALKERVDTMREQITTTNQVAIALPEIVSSNPASRWRVTRSLGVLQHSTDGGATWELQQTNVTVELTAGSSPQPSVCWMVGRAGTVLLTTDNHTWRRVLFPERVDLVAVTATDKDTATVTTQDGSKFNTSDGGATWDREPLQEIPAIPF